MSEKEAIKITEEFLDTIDIKLLLNGNKGKKVTSVMDVIEDMYNEDWYILGHPDVFEGCIFNHMTVGGFMNYVERRYDDKYIFSNVSYSIVTR